jgi:succinylglutamic semialdehyde dehydrogenase
MRESKGQYINGAWTKNKGSILESINPSDGTVIWQGFSATESDISKATQAAFKAFPLWCALKFEQRTQYIKKFAQEIEKNRTKLTQLISQETGKPLWESHTEVDSVINKVNLSIQAYLERTTPKTTNTSEAQACLRYKPHGIAVVLGAFNFPAHLSNGHIVPALLAGNTVLYKPSEYTPAVAEFVMQCWQDSGIPSGVINCLQGTSHCGKILLLQDIQAVYFTGSYLTGLSIHQQFSNRPEVILALEMGGNNPLVLDSELKDLNTAVYYTLLSTFLTAGQRCTCARRIIIPNSKEGNEFLKRFIKASELIKTAPFNERPEPFMGPVISNSQALNLLNHQKKLSELGGRSLLSMKLLVPNTGLLSPGIIDMSQVKNPPDQELFGPLVQIYRYNHFDEAIELANNTHYGLSAGLLSDNKEHYNQFYQRVRAGLINWNRPTTGALSSLPFGGVGFSGNHRPSAYFAADYCAYPVASMEQSQLTMPNQLVPGIQWERINEDL